MRTLIEDLPKLTVRNMPAPEIIVAVIRRISILNS
jgi:hypothetical protein